MRDTTYKYQQLLKPYFQEGNKKGYTLLVMSIFAMIVFGIFAIRPSLVTILTLRKQVADLMVLNDDLNAKVQALVDAQTAYAIRRKDLYLVDLALPDDLVVPKTIEKLSDKLSTTNVKILRLSVQQQGVDQNGATISYHISLGVTGTFPDVVKALKTIENSLLIMNVSNVLLSPRSSDDGTVEMAVDFTVYEYKAIEK